MNTFDWHILILSIIAFAFAIYEFWPRRKVKEPEVKEPLFIAKTTKKRKRKKKH